MGLAKSEVQKSERRLRFANVEERAWRLVLVFAQRHLSWRQSFASSVPVVDDPAEMLAGISAFLAILGDARNESDAGRARRAEAYRKPPAENDGRLMF